MDRSRFFLFFGLTSLLTAAPLSGAEPRFRAETLDPAIGIGYGLAVGDVDGDAKVDILLVDQFDVVWYQNPTWKRHVMASKLSGLRDHVCIAARDLDGDGRVEVAVGANWNPGNTISRLESGSVHYLIPPEGRTQRWTPVRLPSEPTVHRMHWIHPKGRQPELVVLPLHGSGNRNGEGEGDNGALPARRHGLSVPRPYAAPQRLVTSSAMTLTSDWRTAPRRNSSKATAASLESA